MNFIIDQNYLLASKLNDKTTRTDLKFLFWYSFFDNKRLFWVLLKARGMGMTWKLFWDHLGTLESLSPLGVPFFSGARQIGFSLS